MAKNDSPLKQSKLPFFYKRTTHKPPSQQAPGLAGCEHSRKVNSTEENSVS